MLGVGEWAALILCAVAILYYWSGRRDRRLLANIPRPPGLPIIGLLLDFLQPPEDLWLTILTWSNKYGPIFIAEGLGLRNIFIAGPEEVQVVLNSHEHLTKGAYYRFIQPWIGTGLITSTGNKWRSRRKMLTPAFHYKNLEDFVPVFNANSAILVAKLGQHVGDDYVEIEDYVTLCTLDMLCETVMGISINAQLGGEVAYIRAVKRMCSLFIHRSLSPWLHSDFMYRLSPSYREEKRVVQLLQSFSGNVIKKRRLEHQKMKSEIRKDEEAERTKRSSLLDLLLEMSDEEGKMTDGDIREEVDTFMFAGHDTTAAAISWTLLLLGAHQDIQDKVAAELSDIFGSDRRQPTTADLQNMTYMEMVMKESLRLYPSVAVYTRWTQSDLKIGEYTIPPGNNVNISAFNLHRNPNIYPDPDQFDPERFSPEQSSGRHPCAYIPFSTGPRNCLGQKFARLEEKCLLSSILRNFKLESLEYEKVKVISEIVLKPKHPMKIKISARV